MSDFKKYDNYSYREIRWRLRGQGYPEVMIEQTIEAIKAFRAERANQKRKKKEHDLQWGELIFPLQHERKIVRAMRRYTTSEPTPERDEFLEAYAMALDRVLDKIRGTRITHTTMPTHDHWTDYVPSKIVAAMRQASASVPDKAKHKFKEPFARITPIALNNKRRDRLLRKARADLSNVQTQRQLDPENETLKAKEAQITRAIYIINTSEPHTQIGRAHV